MFDSILINVVAPRAFEGSQTKPGFSRLYAGQDHRSPALSIVLWLRFDRFVESNSSGFTGVRQAAPVATSLDPTSAGSAFKGL